MAYNNQMGSSPLGITFYPMDRNDNQIGNYKVVGTSSNIQSLFSRKSDSNNNNNTSFNLAKLSAGGDDQDYSSDISTSSIIDYTSQIPSMKLSYADFAYLRKLGVYTNNRLIVARRYEAPVEDDLLTVKDRTPISTLVSWVDDNKEFIDVTYNEEWTNGEASFKSVLNDIGGDVLVGDNKGGKLGNLLAAGANLVPFPGFTEGLQYEVFNAFGLTDLDATKLPLGNPNLIRESKRRATLDKESAGSGLKCIYSIDFEVEYEQKFINGVDPTTVYYDLIANALSFGTSESVFQFRGESTGAFKKFLDDVGSGDTNRLKAALVTFVAAVSSALKAIGTKIVDLFGGNSSSTKDDAKKAGNDQKQANKAKLGIADLIGKIGAKAIAGIISKYKLRIISVVNSLTGTPSGPWHVTVGNPRRPIFSSGDMIVKDVQLTLGKVLAFNDLPSSIKLKVKMESARNIGLQEIFKKFSCGKARTFVAKRKSFQEAEMTIDETDINNAANTIDQNKVSTAANRTYSSSEQAAAEATYTSGSASVTPDALKGKAVGVSADGGKTFLPGQTIALPGLNGDFVFAGDKSIYSTGADSKATPVRVGSWALNADGTVNASLPKSGMNYNIAAGVAKKI